MPRRQREPLDPYERALLAGPQARGAQPEGEDDEKAPPPLPRRATIGNLRVGAMGLLAFLALIVLVSVLRAGGDVRPLADADCDARELVLSTVEVEQFQPLTYTYAGPDATHRVTVDAQDAAATTPLPGRTAVVARDWAPSDGCGLTGTLGVQLEPGRHVLQVWSRPGACGDAPCDPELVAYAAFVVVPER